MGLTISSSAFTDNSPIPEKYTCKGQDLSPPLTWKDVPAGTKSFVLIVDDPDAPNGTWDHWILFNIASNIQGLTEGEVPTGSVSGINSWGKTGYGGPCPPSGTHRYFFKLYALDTLLSLDSNVNKQDVIDATQHHVLGEATLMGLFSH